MAQIMKFLFIFLFVTFCLCKDENVLMTEVFEIVIDPPMFNWTYEGIQDQFVYHASLKDAPDLPSWINFAYSDRHHCGFLYGVPPNINNAKIPLDIVALNKRTYETRIEHINIIVTEKLNPARFEVHVKIDNLNVDDMFDVSRMDDLKDIFRKQLWKDSEDDLYVTFLSSAIKLGARKPLNPEEGEGVVLRLGSEMPFSSDLIELQEEVRPLWKVPSCPRDFKRTSVERYFRDAGFAMDWCSFRLIDDNNSAMHHSGSTNEKLLNYKENIYEERWLPYAKDDIPERSYVYEIVTTVLLPLLILVILTSMLTAIVCVESENLKDEPSEEYFYNLFHICTDYYYNRNEEKEMECNASTIMQYNIIQKSTNTLHHLNRDVVLTPDPALLSRSHTNSPTSTISRGVHCRPSPPPYVRPKYKPEL